MAEMEIGAIRNMITRNTKCERVHFYIEHAYTRNKIRDFHFSRGYMLRCISAFCCNHQLRMLPFFSEDA